MHRASPRDEDAMFRITRTMYAHYNARKEQHRAGETYPQGPLAVIHGNWTRRQPHQRLMESRSMLST